VGIKNPFDQGKYYFLLNLSAFSTVSKPPPDRMTRTALPAGIGFLLLFLTIKRNQSKYSAEEGNPHNQIKADRGSTVLVCKNEVRTNDERHKRTAIARGNASVTYGQQYKTGSGREPL
jgi:hypothetical protein